jgi:polyisoprenoid-binding protein YceI
MLRRSFLIASLLWLALSIAGCGLLQPPEEASGTIEAIPLDLATELPAPTAAPTDPQEQPTAAAVEPTQTENAGGSESVNEIRIYRIEPASSQVRFELDEDLRGNRITVVGVTNQVAGEFAANPGDLSTVQVGTLQINARTLLTDNDFRNRAIQNEILDTGPYEFINFVPTAVTGLPTSAGVGDTVTFNIAGDLTIRDITRPVTFTVTASMVDDTQITGTASAVVNRADFELNIPSVPNVANVEEEVELYIEFTANAG